ncbi:MAG: 2-oxoacid:acceptor oxidoreductase family protein [Candidatus Lokiarchaeota archaeon]
MSEQYDDDRIIRIVIHARGGMGAVTASQILVEAAYLSGNFEDVQAFPSFGAERRGAPVQAYAKLSKDSKIWDRSQIEHPDIIIVFDESVLNKPITDALKRNGIIIINSEKDPNFFIEKYELSKDKKIVVANMNQLAIERDLTIDGIPVVNTSILGLLAKALPELELENLKKVVTKKLGEKLGKINCDLLEQGYNMAKMV